MDKEDVVYVYRHTHTCTHSGILLSHQKGKILPFATQIDLEGTMLSEISQIKKNSL